MKKFNNYREILNYIKHKYKKDYTSYFKSYSNRLKNIKKTGKGYRSNIYYLNKKAKQLLQTQKATYTRKQLRQLSDKQLLRRWITASKKVNNGVVDKKLNKKLQSFKGEYLRRKQKNALTIQQRIEYHKQYEDFKEYKKIYGGDYKAITSYAISNAQSMNIDDYANYLGVDIDEALNKISNSPLAQQKYGINLNAYIDEEEKIIVYTK